MDKYLKMADVLPNGAVISPLHSEIQQQYADHAINSHDELVENTLHYKQEAGQWEARATKEASRAKDLEAEVERLRDMVIRMQTYLEMAGEYPEKESDNPVRQWLFDAIDCTK